MKNLTTYCKKIKKCIFCQIFGLSKLFTRRENGSQKGITGQVFGSQKGIAGREFGPQITERELGFQISFSSGNDIREPISYMVMK